VIADQYGVTQSTSMARSLTEPVIGLLARINDKPAALAANGSLIVLRADKQVTQHLDHHVTYFRAVQRLSRRTFYNPAHIDTACGQLPRDNKKSPQQAAGYWW
jgi:hypothetical protein